MGLVHFGICVTDLLPVTSEATLKNMGIWIVGILLDEFKIWPQQNNAEQNHEDIIYVSKSAICLSTKCSV